jgi:serine/threonine protein phosphatase 1
MKGLRKLFGKTPEETGRIVVLDRFDGPVYAVGDVHGCLTLYQEMEAAILHDARQYTGPPRIVLLGDLVDRGAQTAALLDLLTGPAPVERRCLMGNHEAMMLAYLTSPDAGDRWLAHGGMETLRSYGLDTSFAALRPRQKTQALAAHLPPRHLQFLRDLPAGLCVGPYLLAHAGADAAAALDAQPLRALLWGGAGRRAPGGLTLVHGHVITPTPDIHPNSIGIDTGAYATGRLTAVRLMQGRPPATLTLRTMTAFQDVVDL